MEEDALQTRTRDIDGAVGKPQLFGGGEKFRKPKVRVRVENKNFLGFRDVAELPERFQLLVVHRLPGKANLLRERELLEQFVERAQGKELAVIDDADARAKARRFLHVMRRVNDRHAVRIQLLHKLEDGVPRLRIHAHGRLVAEQELRTMENGGDDVEATTHSTGISLHFIAAAILQLRRDEAFLDPLAQKRAVQTIEPTEES